MTSEDVRDPYLLVPDAVVDEDEDSVEGVEDAEGGGDGERRPVQEQQAQRPGQHHQEQQRDGPSQPSPGDRRPFVIQVITHFIHIYYKNIQKKK